VAVSSMGGGGGGGGASIGPGGSRRSSSGRGGSRAPEERGFAATLCGFWLGQQCFAISADIVGEVVSVELVTPVPLAPPAVLGLFNLRGTPVALVDLVPALDLTGTGEAEPLRPGQQRTSLVLRPGESSDFLLGALISRMEMVIPAGRGRFRPRSESTEENPLVEGFLEISERGSLVLTVLNSAEIVARLSELRLRRVDDER
jgi:chemotaxis signal transduction protein